MWCPARRYVNQMVSTVTARMCSTRASGNPSLLRHGRSVARGRRPTRRELTTFVVAGGRAGVMASRARRSIDVLGASPRSLQCRPMAIHVENACRLLAARARSRLYSAITTWVGRTLVGCREMARAGADSSWRVSP